MRARSTFKNEALSRALDQAMGGDPRPLHSELSRLSGLPGPRANMGVLEAFAEECAARGERVDAVAIALAKLDADRAPGATSLEFLPMCGVAALGARAAVDAKARPQMLAILHECADDLRFRVRETVPPALARIGERAGDALLDALGEWMNGFFHAAAVLRAMSTPAFMDKLGRPDAVVEKLDEAFQLASNASRSTQRFPGFKALVDALGAAPAALAGRFGVPIFDLLVRWSTVKEPVLREAIEKNLGGSRLVGRHGA